MVVVVARCFGGGAGEECGVGSFKVDDAAGVFGEIGMLLGIVKTVFVVSGDLGGEDPWTERGVGFGVPHFAEDGGVAKVLIADEHPAVAVVVEIDRRAVDDDGFVGVDIAELDESFVGFHQAFGDELVLCSLAECGCVVFPGVMKLAVGFAIELGVLGGCALFEAGK